MTEIHLPPFDPGKLQREFLKLRDGQRLHFIDSAPTSVASRGTIVLLHSAIGNLWTFKHQLGREALDGYRVIAYDRRGHGGTPALDSESGPSDTDDLLELLDALCPEQPVHLLGTAAGGRVAADFAREYPGRIASLTLVCSLAGLAKELYPQGTDTLLAEEFLALPPYLKELGPVYRAENPQGTREWQDIVASTSPAHTKRKPSAWVSTPGSASNSPLAPGLAGLRDLAGSGGPLGEGVALHLITADADPYTTPIAYARLAALLPSATLNIVKHSGHSPYWEQPRAFNSLIRSLLGTPVYQGASQ